MIIKVAAADRKCPSPNNTTSALAVQRKYRKRRSEIREREYRKLKSVLPAIANRYRVTKVTVIEEAIKYIDQLHDALAERLKAGENTDTQVIVTRPPLLSTPGDSNIPPASSCPHPQNRRLFHQGFGDDTENSISR